MHLNAPGRLVVLALALTFLLVVPAAASAAPKLVGPKAGAVLALGSEPTFKVRDGSQAARQYRVYITIGTSKKTNKVGDLKRTKIGTFTSGKRRGNLHTYKTEDYSFPEWFMNRPGKYYWQAFHIDCRVKGCHVHSKIRSFRVQ
jgi:hypothetical protein